MDPGLNQLLKWSVENSVSDPAAPTEEVKTSRDLNPQVLNALFGGPSDADLLKLSMSAILSTDPEVTISDKEIAFDNFEQLVENIDNANNLAVLELWSPLLKCLGHEESVIRKMAAWCCGTAVQNNEKCQERLVAMGGIEALARLAVKEGEGREVRRKAVYALSSGVRNYQPGMDALVGELVRLGRTLEKIDAADMDACDVLIGGLREEAAKAENP